MDNNKMGCMSGRLTIDVKDPSPSPDSPDLVSVPEQNRTPNTAFSNTFATAFATEFDMHRVPSFKITPHDG